jgi:hypothetical protein
VESNENVTSACKRPWHGADGYLRVCTSTSSNAGPHGSTPADGVATTAVGVARAKAAQAGYPHRGLPGPRKPLRSFGRRAPLVGLGHKSRRTLKGIVPEVAAHVSVLLGGACGGGGVAQPHALQLLL